MKKSKPINTDLKKYIEHLRPFVELALDGKVNGHNMNRNFWEVFGKNTPIPIQYNDAVYSILKLFTCTRLADRRDEKNRLALNFIFDDKDVFEAGSLWADVTGIASPLYFTLKTLEIYLNK